MGSDYYPAPSPATRIVGPDGVPLSGDVSLTAGNGAKWTRLANGLIVAADPLTALRSVAAFGPGAAVARTLQKGSAPAPVLTYLDVFLGTAPVGVSGANCANVQVAGSVSGGPVVVPLAAGVSEYHLGLSDLTTTLAGQSRSGSDGQGQTDALAISFQVSTQIVVWNADIIHGTPGGTANIRGGIATGVVQGVTSTMNPNWLTDTAGNKCYQDVSNNLYGSSSRTLFTFPTNVGFVLNTGTTYWFVISKLSLANLEGCYINAALNGANLGNAINIGPTPLVRTQSATDVFDTTLGSLGHPTFSLYGAIMGTTLSGSVVISQTITGAPPGTTGSDANIMAYV